MRPAAVFSVFCSLVVLCAASACTSSHSYASTSLSGHFGCDSYGDRLQISWLINPFDTDVRMILTFTDFDTEANYDFVKVYDGSSDDANLLGSFSGSVIPGPFTSSTNAFYIVFTADQYVEGGGFHAEWSSFEYNQGITPCTSNMHRVIPSNEGTLGCDTYGNNINTSWRIEGDEGERIALTFETFDTESNYDIVSVYDGENSSAECIGTFSGSDIPPPVTSTSNELYIQFVTDYSLTGAGFSASWESLESFADPCFNNTNTIVLGRQGYVGCPYGYGNNVNSTWLINILGNVIIQLNFLTLSLEDNHDFVYVYDGATTSAPLLGRFTGLTTPDPVVSSGNRLFITLTTDSSGVSSGFTAAYESVHALQPDGCSRSGTFLLTDSEDSLGCNGYLGGVTEEWHLQARSEEEVINLTWHTFNTEANHDYIYVYDGNTTDAASVYIVSGDTLPDPVVSSGQFLLVKFVADANGVQGSGFSAIFESVPGQSQDQDMSCQTSHDYFLTDPEGVFGCDGYGDNVLVSFQIHVESGYIILLDFDTFFTEALFDFVSVYDGPNQDSTPLGSFSGGFRPPEISSSSNYLYVLLASDSGVTRAGFTAEYSSRFTGSDADSCFENADYEIFRSAGTFGCIGYGSNVETTWLITVPTSSSRVLLNFNAFQTEYGYDIVNVYDGGDASARLLASYSGYVIPEPVHSTGPHLFVTFSSDESVEYDGFRADFHEIHHGSVIGHCTESTHRTYTEPSGSFGCSGYANSLDSSWAVTVNQGQRITLTILTINTELYYDYINVYDGVDDTATLLGSYSGNVPPSPLTSTSESFYVTFHSDSSVSTDYDGFTISYISFGSFENSCDTSEDFILNRASGTFGCDGYSNSVTVTWTINSYGAIYINFEQFDTEAAYDVVELYDGTDSSAPLIATYSGTTAPPVSSTGENIFIKFTSDSSLSRNGFVANFVTVSNLDK